MPPGYELADVAGPSAPAGFWGLSDGWTSEPPQCSALVGPGPGNSAPGQGVSASGGGGIVYAVVAPAPVAVDDAVVADCGQWTMASGHATADAGLVDAPRIDGAQTLGISTATTTVVESGTETDSHAATFSAYLDGYVVFVTLVTDPGLPPPPLEPQFAADLLVKTVSALRGSAPTVG
jgi:hypothetical protein